MSKSFLELPPWNRPAVMVAICQPKPSARLRRLYARRRRALSQIRAIDTRIAHLLKP